jgi:hypothetical protein
MKYTVSLRLVGDEQAVRAAIAELEAELGLRVHIAPPRKGRKGDEWLAYGMLAVPAAEIPTTILPAPQAYTGITKRLTRRKP